jgi:hypothetical protein
MKGGQKIMQNLQQIPGETDVDKPMPDDRAPSEEKRNERRDIPLPQNSLPTAPISEPPTNQKPMVEPNGEPPRLMKFYTSTQRRIF